MKHEFLNRVHFEYLNNTLVARLYTETLEEAETLAEYSGIQCEIHDADPCVRNDFKDNWYCIVWYSSDVVDLAVWLNAGNGCYRDILSPLGPSYGLTCKCTLTDPDAIMPARAHPSDSGYDLTVIREVKRVGDVVSTTRVSKLNLLTGTISILCRGAP